MPDDTDILSLPLILPSQAQKHVTHNEALLALDVLVQLAVISRDQTVPPELASVGDRHIVPAGAVLDWAGQGGRIAVMTQTGWQFYVPRPGWQAYVLAEHQVAAFDGLAWAAQSEGAARFAQLGVSAEPDATNRLSVSAPATLLNHAGAGHQLKLNKAAPGDTASLLFQTGFSGRAEMGTTGSDGFSIKVSADGSSFATGLSIAPGDAVVELPAGARLPDGAAATPALGFAADPDTGLCRPAANQIGFAVGGVAPMVLSQTGLALNLPLTGTAVTQTRTDTGANRLLKVGDFGLGGGQAPGPETLLADIDQTDMPQGFFQTSTQTLGAFPAGENKFGQGMVMRYNNTNFTQIWMSALSDTLYTRRYRSSEAQPWSPWRPLFGRHNVLGPVSQSGGSPTGAVVERGSNANGDYVRFADGTQICTRVNLSAANASTALGSLFRSANISWTFPAAFAAAPMLTSDCDEADTWATNAAAPTATIGTLRAIAAVSKGAAMTLRATAIGRWF
ncbi:MAG: DUF2793 domain-containing protein [Paracoccaceae bacterium]